MAAVEADGRVSIEEMALVQATLSRTRMFNHLTELQFRDLINTTSRFVRTEGVGTIINVASNAPPYEMKETVFAIALDIILADGVITANEKEFIENLGSTIGLDQGIAQKIAEVIVIRNRF